MTEPEIMRLYPPPADLAGLVAGFAHRRDMRGGDAVILLPEARTSVQLRRADPYWLREREDASPWRMVPRISLWGPRLESGYGYARRHIHAYAFALTPHGFRTIAARAPGALANDVADLGAIAPVLAAELEAAAMLEFDGWMTAACTALRRLSSPAPSRISGALALLADPECESVADAARRFGLSERQFRRAFSSEYGASPKAYQRILRFDRALRALHPDPWEAPSPPRAGDFADQAHMIREFCALARITPGEYSRSKARHGDRILRSVVASGIAPPPEAVQGETG